MTKWQGTACPYTGQAKRNSDLTKACAVKNCTGFLMGDFKHRNACLTNAYGGGRLGSSGLDRVLDPRSFEARDVS